MTKISRRWFLKGGSAAVVVGGATPLWLQWLNTEMGKLGRQTYSFPAHYNAEDDLVNELAYRIGKDVAAAVDNDLINGDWKDGHFEVLSHEAEFKEIHGIADDDFYEWARKVADEGGEVSAERGKAQVRFLSNYGSQPGNGMSTEATKALHNMSPDSTVELEHKNGIWEVVDVGGKDRPFVLRRELADDIEGALANGPLKIDGVEVEAGPGLLLTRQG